MTRPQRWTQFPFAVPGLAVAALMLGALSAQASPRSNGDRHDRVTQQQSVKQHRAKTKIKRERARAINQRRGHMKRGRSVGHAPVSRAVLNKNKRRGTRFINQRGLGRPYAKALRGKARRHQHRSPGKALNCRSKHRGFISASHARSKRVRHFDRLQRS